MFQFHGSRLCASGKQHKRSLTHPETLSFVKEMRCSIGPRNSPPSQLDLTKSQRSLHPCLSLKLCNCTLLCNFSIRKVLLTHWKRAPRQLIVGIENGDIQLRPFFLPLCNPASVSTLISSAAPLFLCSLYIVYSDTIDSVDQFLFSSQSPSVAEY